MSDRQTLTADQVMLQYLGASVLLCWQELPKRMQELILDQANDAVGIVPAPMIRDQIASFLTRRAAARRHRVVCRLERGGASPGVEPSLSMKP
jgi:hypothetical protein